MALRVKFFLTCTMLVLVVCCTIYTAKVTTAEWQSFQEAQKSAGQRDVRLIQSWMSIAYIAHAYHVPESYLEQTLKLLPTNKPNISHLSISLLTATTRRPARDLIHDIQNAITRYRQLHPTGSAPPSATGKRLRSAVGGAKP